MPTAPSLPYRGGPFPGGSSAEFRERAAATGVQVESRLEAPAYGLLVDLDSYGVYHRGKPLDLTPRQVELLALFLAAPGRVWSREQLHWICWQDTAPSRRVDVQLCRIRAKLGTALFRNIRDRGWGLRPAAA